MTLLRRGYDDNLGCVCMVTVVVSIVVVIVTGCDRSPGRSAYTGSDYRSVPATHFGANGAAQRATDRAADRSILDEIIGPACCRKCAADHEKQCETKLTHHAILH